MSFCFTFTPTMCCGFCPITGIIFVKGKKTLGFKWLTVNYLYMYIVCGNWFDLILIVFIFTSFNSYFFDHWVQTGENLRNIIILPLKPSNMMLKFKTLKEVYMDRNVCTLRFLYINEQSGQPAWNFNHQNKEIFKELYETWRRICGN